MSCSSVVSVALGVGVYLSNNVAGNGSGSRCGRRRKSFHARKSVRTRNGQGHATVQHISPRAEVARPSNPAVGRLNMRRNPRYPARRRSLGLAGCSNRDTAFPCNAAGVMRGFACEKFHKGGGDECMALVSPELRPDLREGARCRAHHRRRRRTSLYSSHDINVAWRDGGRGARAQEWERRHLPAQPLHQLFERLLAVVPVLRVCGARKRDAHAFEKGDSRRSSTTCATRWRKASRKSTWSAGCTPRWGANGTSIYCAA